MRLLLGAPLLAAALVVPAGHAVADPAPTCQGRTVTIVGTNGTVTGTEGDDVVLAQAGSSVRTGGGDDLICVVAPRPGAASTVDVDAGAGDDEVHVIEPGPRSTYVRLGTGADTFVGGSGADMVDTGDDSDRDVVDTGAGTDDVRAGDRTGVFDDVVRTGPGSDRVRAVGAGMTETAVIDFGADVDEELMLSDVGSAAVVVDAAARTATLAGVPAWRWSGAVASYRLWATGPVDFLGTDAAERLEVSAPRTIRTGGGDDTLTVLGGVAEAATYDGGPGTDLLQVVAGVGRTSVDLGASRIALPSSGAPATLVELEDYRLTGERLRVRGSAGADDVHLHGCRVRVDAGAGADEITSGYFGWDLPRAESCNARSARVDAGSGHDVVRLHVGNDQIRGGRGNDVLDGGAGDDRVWGGRGFDRCFGEKRSGCERGAPKR